MKILALFFLGILQGLTEFLPVSSSGHLVLFSKIFSFEESLFLSILLHLATLFSICVVLHKDIWKLIKNPFSKQTMMIAVATIPTCLIAIILMPIIKMVFNGKMLWFCFLFSALLLFVADKFSKKRNVSYKLDLRSAFAIGVAQGFAVFPGISRSGATISTGLLCKKDKIEVAKFSFLLSIPVILMSLIMEAFEMCTQKMQISAPIGGIVLSCVSAFVVGVFALKATLKLTERANLKWFSIYLIVVGCLTCFLL